VNHKHTTLTIDTSKSGGLREPLLNEKANSVNYPLT